MGGCEAGSERFEAIGWLRCPAGDGSGPRLVDDECRFDVWCELGNGRRWQHNDLEGPLSWELAVLVVRWIEAAVARDAALLPVVVNVRLAAGGS